MNCLPSLLLIETNDGERNRVLSQCWGVVWQRTKYDHVAQDGYDVLLILVDVVAVVVPINVFLTEKKRKLPRN